MVTAISQAEPRSYSLLSVNSVLKITGYALMCLTAAALCLVAIAWMNTPAAQQRVLEEKSSSPFVTRESLEKSSSPFVTHESLEMSSSPFVTRESHLLGCATQYGGEECDFLCPDICVIRYPIDRSDLARCIESCALNCIADAKDVTWGSSLQDRFLDCVSSYYTIVG